MHPAGAFAALFFLAYVFLANATAVAGAFNFNSRITPKQDEEENQQTQFKNPTYNRQEVAQYPVIDWMAGLEDKLKTLDLSISKFQTSVEYITQQLGRRLESIEQKLARLEAATDVQRIAKQQDQSTQLNTKLDVINEKLSTRLSTIDGKIDAKLERSWTKLDMLSHGYDKQFEDLMGRVVKQDTKRDAEYQRSLQKLEVVENLVRSMGKIIVDSFGEGRKVKLQQQQSSSDSEPDYEIVEGIYTRLDRIINETIVNKPKCEAANLTEEVENRFKGHFTKMILTVQDLKNGLVNGTFKIDGDLKCGTSDLKEELQKLRQDMEAILGSSEQQSRDMGEALSVVGRTFEAKLQNLYQNVAHAFKVLQESQVKLTDSCALQADRQHSEMGLNSKEDIISALRNTTTDISVSFEKSLSQLKEYVDGVISNGMTSHGGGSNDGIFGSSGKSIEYGSRKPTRPVLDAPGREQTDRQHELHNLPQTEDPKADFNPRPPKRLI